MAKKRSQGLTTEQEFQQAIQLIINCRGTLNCGCDYDEQQADWLYYQSKQYVEDYKKRIKKQ